MKALTICQPYAHLIVVTQEKSVENRDWRTDYRGPLLIHAGKSLDYMSNSDAHGYVQSWDQGNKAATLEISDPQGRPVALGALIGRVDVLDCAHIADIHAGVYDSKFPWLKTHAHTHGEFCLVLGNAIQFPKPIPMRGQLGLFNVRFNERTGVCTECGCHWTSACPGGCHWVAPNLCSSCVGAVS